MPPIPKVVECSCGRSYTQEEWEELPNRNIWRLPWGEVLEMRDCWCRSTISVQLSPGEPEKFDGIPRVHIPAWIRN